MAVKNLGVLTLDLVKELTQSENNDNELVMTKSLGDTLRDKLLAQIDQVTAIDPMDYSKHAESIALAHQVAISNNILQPLADHSFFEQADRQLMEKTSRTSAKISEEFKKEQERKNKFKQDQTNQIVSAIVNSNNQQVLVNENTQLKAEIEKLKQENDKLLKDNKKLKKLGSIESTRAKNNVLDIIYVLVDMAKLPIDTPYKAYAVMQKHAETKDFSLSSKDIVADWLKEANDKN
ncbi:hypothetical protein [Acinetobacter defluvii]|uniref:hypothetical protein n=1 Tax=Acinetobacter defluvii TaxID=1871111 RepID=UPI003AF75CF7